MEEVSDRIIGREEPFWVVGWGHDKATPLPLWISRVMRADKVLRRQMTRRHACDAAISLARLNAGLHPYPIITRRPKGRPPAPHPLPRREVKIMERLDSDTHRRDHKACYVHQCLHCYRREYLYFDRHPERRPTDVSTAGCREIVPGRYEGATKRRWIDPGWVEAERKELERKMKIEVPK